MRVLGTLGTLEHPPVDPDAEFIPEGSRALTNRKRRDLRTENHLYHPRTVTKVDEEHLPVIAQGIHPTRQFDLLPHLGEAQGSTIRSTFLRHLSFPFRLVVPDSAAICGYPPGMTAATPSWGGAQCLARPLVTVTNPRATNIRETNRKGKDYGGACHDHGRPLRSCG